VTGDRHPDWPERDRSRRSGRHTRPPEEYGNPDGYADPDDYTPPGSYPAPDDYAPPGSYPEPDRFGGPDPRTAPGRFDRPDPLSTPGRFDGPDPLSAPGRFAEPDSRTGPRRFDGADPLSAPGRYGGPDPLTTPGQYAPPGPPSPPSPPGPYGPPDRPAQTDPFATRPPRTPPDPASYGQSGPHARVNRGPVPGADDQTDPSADQTDPFSQRDRYAAQARLGAPDRYSPPGGGASPEGYGPPGYPREPYDQERGRPDSFDQPPGPGPSGRPGRSGRRGGGYGPDDSYDRLATRTEQNGYGRPGPYGPPDGDATSRFDNPRGLPDAPRGPGGPPGLGAPAAPAGPGTLGEQNGYGSAAAPGDRDDGPFRWRPPADASEPEALAPLPDYHGAADHGTRQGPRDWDASQEHDWDLNQSDSSMGLAEPVSGPVDRTAWRPDADEFARPDEWDDADQGEGLIPGLDSRRGRGGRDGRPRRRVSRVLAPLLALVLLVVLGAGGYKLYRHFQSPDFTGPGFGEVTVQVPQGASAFSMAPELVKLGVVASTSSFISAAKSNANPDGLEPGFFRLRHHMNSALAYALLISPASRIQSVATIPDGLRETEILATLEAKTGTSASAFATALKDTSALGLPSYAKGNPEGFLFPATYDFNPGTSALSMLQTMVTRFNQEAASINLTAAAGTAKLTPNQVITVASILEAEAGAPKYYADVAEVIYNRLNQGIKLGLDSTVNYALHRFGVSLTTTQMQVNSPYNTFIHTGLPPGPIDSPGNAAIEAALHPAHGPLLYFVTVNVKTGLTKFATTSAGFQQLVNECDANNSC
jgi:UPF0755 protein